MSRDLSGFPMGATLARIRQLAEARSDVFAEPAPTEDDERHLELERRANRLRAAGVLDPEAVAAALMERDAARAEVERLRGIVEVNDQRLADCWDQSRAEVKRLKAELAESEERRLGWAKEVGRMSAQCADLRAEVGRLTSTHAAVSPLADVMESESNKMRAVAAVELWSSALREGTNQALTLDTQAAKR